MTLRPTPKPGPSRSTSGCNPTRSFWKISATTNATPNMLLGDDAKNHAKSPMRVSVYTPYAALPVFPRGICEFQAGICFSHVEFAKPSLNWENRAGDLRSEFVGK